MPSDPRVAAALAALAKPIAEFRASVHGALQQADSFVAAHSATATARAAGAAVGLGKFADMHIDAGKFAALFPASQPAAPDAMAALERAIKVLRAVTAQGDALFVAKVTAGKKLGATIDAALADAGAAFGAIVIAELVRGGRYNAADHARLLDPSEFRAWNRAERRFAPPLVVEVDGADLYAGALLDFVDGREKIVLVVRGAAPPAPLVRCVTPGTYVLQTVDGADLEKVAGFEGPAIAALVPQGAATFAHNPSAGNETWQRLSVTFLPPLPTKAVGGFSAWQMGEDVKMLADLARTPFAVPGAPGAKSAPAIGANDAVDRLASWLLDASGVSGTN